MRVSLNLCLVDGYSKRNWLVIYDETVVSPGEDLVYGLEDDPVAVGPEWDFNENLDHSIHRISPEGEFTHVKPEQLAKQQLSFVMKPVHHNKETWEFAQFPRREGHFTKGQMFKLLGIMLATGTGANGDIPPFGVANDLLSSHDLIRLATLGNLNRETLDSAEFFEHCFNVDSRLPQFPYGALQYKTTGFVLFGCGDPWHLKKSLAEQFRSGAHVILMGHVFTRQLAALVGGCFTARHFLIVFTGCSKT